ncbi:DNA-3-methyladenine glycosylase family protein [Spirosoma foliorum]|uniref:DNA-3-methyladenine glycosylase II n=1 Tax=Spirosoma foliorum TaxID=2710596 RepID=A0A7G5H0R2_9BACT|nr:DNA-3-methyladenine glycosylase [Spirosoma foliorum]QMW04704.1 DNA-3-methyladenine glycosylase 2 family protein [Spirosoma foliorum]
MAIPATFNLENYHELCEHLASQDGDLKAILDAHGYPPMWTRENTFETLVHIILEQQVSLASALATLNKLKEKTTEITPDSILRLNDEEMRACFVSRQKMGYLRGLAQALKNGEIDLNELAKLPNDEVRERLVQLKGIGNWTVDVYLMFTLQRADIFPIGDLAAVNALKRLKQLASSSTREEVLEISEGWEPFRTVACMMLWHYYLSNPRRK